MAFYRKPDDKEQEKWSAELSKPGMEPYRDYPPWGLYRYKGGHGERMTVETYYPKGFSFKCSECEDDHTVPGPAVCMVIDPRFNMVAEKEPQRVVAPLAMMEPADLPPPEEPVGVAGSKWVQ